MLANSVDIDPAEEQSDLGLHCLPFGLHLLDTLLYGKITSFKLWDNYCNHVGCRNVLDVIGSY